jgi:hypothetical protein
MHEHPKAVKLPKVNDDSEMLGNVHRAGSRDFVNTLAEQFVLNVL